MRAHELVLHRIERDLAEGVLAVGDRLPGERVLAGDLAVSRSSVREAIRVLEAMGVVRTAVGSGPEAGAIVVADPISSIGAALRLHTATKHLPIADLVETRILLESWALREAADRRPRPDLTAVDGCLDAMDDATLGPEQFLRLDAAFHVAMSELAGNVVVAAMMAALRDSIHGYVLAGVPLLDDWPAVAATLRREHRAIVAAVRRGHGIRAGELVCAHIRGYVDLITPT
ncbi:FadR/GntR family transcriptional regulator [Mycolicibacterium litorale]|uniref:GntR family transcriptional regulator n=1 Tax=Mycolicibacterium litorale TaxID=758802 RepID=A0AAD1IXN1_9MYCO|nr:FCD domain-containing protein [Mycolicibacterium litorale]MCV7418399.1 FadR family transcriptional regulator [Mycolicibacterium litorale]TDY06204.1 GntR family transcriptional regulator [Mycolicibacterium litorale]BBY19653.1 GntR family transcriptional regulator [Mycolicibacterium litorale]